jgi:hypothetical protein
MKPARNRPEGLLESTGVLTITLVEPESLFIQLPKQIKRLSVNAGASKHRFKRLQKLSSRLRNSCSPPRSARRWNLPVDRRSFEPLLKKASLPGIPSTIRGTSCTNLTFLREKEL